MRSTISLNSGIAASPWIADEATSRGTGLDSATGRGTVGSVQANKAPAAIALVHQRLQVDLTSILSIMNHPCGKVAPSQASDCWRATFFRFGEECCPNQIIRTRCPDLARLSCNSQGNSFVRDCGNRAALCGIRKITYESQAPAILWFIPRRSSRPGIPKKLWAPAGIASGNGTVVNTGVRRATITVNYLICAVSGFKGCSEEKTAASVSTSLTVVP